MQENEQKNVHRIYKREILEIQLEYCEWRVGLLFSKVCILKCMKWKIHENTEKGVSSLKYIVRQLKEWDVHEINNQGQKREVIKIYIFSLACTRRHVGVCVVLLENVVLCHSERVFP